MYPRNAASPPEISVGSLVSTTDGSLATTGASVRVKSGGSWAAGAGTLNCDATSGIWSYVPTQGETNASHFIVAVYRSGHVSIERTVVTTVSEVAGYAGLDWSQVRAATTTVALSGTTISTSQVVASVSGAVGSVTGSVGSVTGAVGSVTAGVTVSTNNDKTGYSLATAPPTAAAIADAVWDEAYAGHTTAGTFGKLMDILRKANTVIEGAILSSPTPTTTVFRISGADYPTGALAGSVLWMNSGASQEQNSPIISTTNNGDGTITVTLENPLVTAPIAGDTVLIDPTSHVHSVAEIQSGLATASDMSTLLSRLGAFTGSGLNTVLGFLRAIMSKAASTPSDVGGTFSATTDSIEAIRDAQQAGTGDASQATLEAVQDTVDAIAASLSGTPIEVVGRVADGGSITLYAGDDMRVRSGTEISVTITDVGGAIYSRLNTIGVANLAFGASRPSQPAGAIDGTVAALSQAGAGAAQTVTIDIEIEDGGERLAYADNYVWQIVSSRAQGSEYDTYTEIEGSLAVRRRVAVPVRG